MLISKSKMFEVDVFLRESKRRRLIRRKSTLLLGGDVGLKKMNAVESETPGTRGTPELNKKNLSERQNKKNFLWKFLCPIRDFVADSGFVLQDEQNPFRIFSDKVDTLFHSEKSQGGLQEMVPESGVWKVAKSDVTSKKEILKKEIEQIDGDVFVYLTLLNTGGRIMKDVQVIDTLPKDATDLVVFTPDGLLERTDRSLIWGVSYLGRGAKRIFHYKMSSNGDETPMATSRWADSKFKGFKDFGEIARRVGGEK